MIDNIDATELGRRDSLQHACHLLEVVNSYHMFVCDLMQYICVLCSGYLALHYYFIFLCTYK